MGLWTMPQATDLAQALQRLGAKRVEATLVAALASDPALGTKDLVDRTGLRQPEVSTGMAELRQRDWVVVEAVPRPGRGRPMHRYRLVADPLQVRLHYEAQARAVMATFESALEVVRDALRGDERRSAGGAM